MIKRGRKYSGKASEGFWKRVASIKNRRAHALVYLAGCALQEHEQRVLEMLAEAQKPLSRK